jgi:1,4-dihydroxy-2-naphthoate octaprenyltransferase
MRYLMLFFRMARPTQLLLIALVYSWGVMMALVQGYSWSMPTYLYGLFAGILVSISIHYVNEYADYETDALTMRTLYSGGSGALQDLDLDRGLALKGAFLSVIAGFILAIFGSIEDYLPLLSLALLTVAVVLGWGYSLTPLKLAWRGWGEVDNAFLGAILLPVYGYLVISQRVDTTVISAAIPFGLLAFVNLLATHWADRVADQAVGKYSLASKLTSGRLHLVYLLSMLGAYLYAFGLAPYPRVVQLSSLAILPLSILGFLRFTKQHSPAPSVFPMVVYLVVQLISWGYVYFV